MVRRSVLLTSLLLLGCPVKRVELGREGPPVDAADCLRRVALAEAGVTTLSGDARLFIDAAEGKGSVDLFLAVAPPAIHLTQLDFFGRPQAALTTDGERFGLLRDGEFLRGPATAQNLRRFLPVVIPPAELAQVLLGRAPRLAHESAALAFDERLQLFVLTLRRGAVVQTLHVQPPLYRVVRSERSDGAYALSFGQFREENGVQLPRLITLDAAGVKARLELTLKDVAVNEATEPSWFELAPPEDVPVVEVQ